MTALAFIILVAAYVYVASKPWREWATDDIHSDDPTQSRAVIAFWGRVVVSALGLVAGMAIWLVLHLVCGAST